MTKIFWILSFLLPFQLSFHFKNLTSFVFGFEVDYLIPAIFITDLVVFWLFAVWVKTKKINISPKTILITLGVFVFIVINCYQSDNLVPTLFKWLKVLQMGLLIFIIKNSKEIDVFKHFVKPLSYSVLVVCILAIWQNFVKGSVGGAFYLLGERAFRFSDPGISPHPYSTFSHPNSMAGFLFAFIVFFLNLKQKYSGKFFYLVLGLVTITLLLSSSLNILVAMFSMFIIYKLKPSKNILVLILLLLTILTPLLNTTNLIDQSVVDRTKLARASVEIIKSSPLIGVSLNNFIPSLLNTSYLFENAWQMQPVHNIFLLVLSETGVLGFLFFISLFFIHPTSYALLPIALTGLFDHYWLTLQQNMLLFAMIIGFSFGKIKK